MTLSAFLILKYHCGVPANLHPLAEQTYVEWAAGMVSDPWMVKLVVMVNSDNLFWAECLVEAYNKLVL